MALSEGLLQPIESPLVPLQYPIVIFFFRKYLGHIVDCCESRRMVLSEGLLKAIESPLMPL
jgi:hypothetical protein